MRYFSLNDKKKQKFSFRQATLLGQSPDGGLFFPERIPRWDKDFISSLASLPAIDWATKVMKPYIEEDMDEETLRGILDHTLSFDIPLKKISEHIYGLQLYHGPTMAFKDVGASFLSRCLQHFSKDIEKQIVVLAATSGDTGGAVAHSFSKAKDIQVVILYPAGGVSPLQEKQLSYPSDNVHTLEVKGSFDDCQALVKAAFKDEDFNKKIYLTSANSINISRWLPQQLYYILAYQKWMEMGEKEAPIFCVPSGNFGNLCAGILAHRSGLPVKRFIAACNANDTVIRYLNGEKYEARKVIPTLSNAMDISAPNNFIRIEELFDKDFSRLKSEISGYSVGDERALETIKAVYKRYGHILDPHSAVAYQALCLYQEKNPSKGIILETAHPLKFSETVEKAIGVSLPINDSIKRLLEQDKRTSILEADYHSFKEWAQKTF